MKRRRRGEGRRARADPRDPELGRRRERRAEAARQRVGARAQAGEALRRHALGQRRPRAEPRRADPRDDVPARPRRPGGRDHRLRRAPRRARRARRGGSRRTRSSSSRYQERAILSQSLSTADVHVVGLARGLAGYVVPSRLYGILAAGRPVIAAADAESETAQLVARGRLRGRRAAGQPVRARRRDPGGARRRVRPRRRWAAARARSPSAEADRSIAIAPLPRRCSHELEAAGARRLRSSSGRRSARSSGRTSATRSPPPRPRACGGGGVRARGRPAERDA